MLTRRNWLCLVALVSVIAAVFVVGNWIPRRHEGEPPSEWWRGGARVEYGFPFIYKTKWVISGKYYYLREGGEVWTVEGEFPASRDAPIEVWPDVVYSHKYDEQTLQSNVGIGLAATLLAATVWVIYCRSQNRRRKISSPAGQPQPSAPARQAPP
jgi:hypothetical protein